jgi:hypothetical protein
VDGVQQATVITFFVVIIKANVVIFTLDDDENQLLYYVDLVTIRNSECTAIYGSIQDSSVCAESGTATVKNACYVSL